MQGPETRPDTPTQPEQRLRWYDLLFLLILALAIFVPGQDGIPPIDRDESRYAVATSQMLASGNLIDIRFQDEARHLQPAGIYWLQSLSVLAFSSPDARAIWAHRIPSLTGATLAVLLTGWLGAFLFGRRVGLIAGVLVAVTVLLGVEARMGKIDAAMLAVVTVAQAALMMLYLDRAANTKRVAAVFWAAIGVGLMLKGPVPTLVSLLTILGLVVADRRVAWLSRLHAKWGVLLAAAIVLPWLIAINVVTEGAFIQNAIGHSLLGKVATGQQAHGAPPGYHLLAFSLAFWPGALFAVLALPHVWRNRADPRARFLIAWILPVWILFELVATKLPHYTLPTYPAIAILTAAALSSGAALPALGRWRKAGLAYLGLWFVIGTALALAGFGVTLYLDRRFDVVSALLGIAGVGLVYFAARFIASGNTQTGFITAMVAGFVVFAGTFGWSMPRLQTLWLSPRIEAAVMEAARCERTILVTIPYHEPSLIYLHGPYTTRLARSPEDAAETLAADAACTVAVIGEAERARFLDRAAALSITPELRATIGGRNYSNGRLLSLSVFTAYAP